MNKKSSLKVGVHVSISGSLLFSFDRAKERECDCFQLFTKNPRGWKAKPISPSDAEAFAHALHLYAPGIVFAHVSYLPNLAGDNPAMYEKSIQGFCLELERCETLTIPFLVTHLGHAADDPEYGRVRVASALNTALETIPGKTTILLENTAGEAHSVGSALEDISDVIGRCYDPSRIGVCFDTCHAFAAGYDLRNEESIGEVTDLFEDLIGLSNLKLIHLNDAKADLGSGLDRHEHIGLGKIGEEGIRSILHAPGLQGIPCICETPVDDRRGDLDNIKIARMLAL